MIRAMYYFLFTILMLLPAINCDISNELDLESFLESANQELAIIHNQQTNINWENDAYYNEDEENDEKKPSQEEILSKELIKLTKYLNSEILKYEQSTGINANLKEQILNIPKLGYDALNEKDMQELENVTTNMSSVYRTVNLCSYKNQDICNITLIPDVQDIIFYSNDVDEIEYYWKEWNTKSGLNAKNDFGKFIKLYRKAAKLNGYNKASDYWFRKFGQSNDIKKILDKIILQLEPLFKQFHARVRSLLRNKYGIDTIKKNWPYPQHLSEKYIGAAFKNEEHDGIELPYPEAGMPNITEAFLNQGYLPRSFYEIAENFYQSIGLKGLNKEFWNEYVLPKGDPSETYLYCTNTPHNYQGADLIRMTHCPNVDLLRYMNMFESISTVHFYKESKIQPIIFQSEPFPDFLEQLGKVFSLSATSPNYLEKIEILPRNSFNAEHRLNRLYFMAFQEVFVLPIFYVLDKYRVDVLDAGIKTWDNCAFWDLNEKYLGAIPPIKRTQNDFDIPSKLLISVDEVYTGSIIGTVMKYQVYKYLCEKAGEYKKDDPYHPLDYCDLSDHPEIGDNISKAMALGSSKPWPEILATLTDGQTELSLDGFLEYYEPLFEWLKSDNELNKNEIGWLDSKQCQA